MIDMEHTAFPQGVFLPPSPFQIWTDPLVSVTNGEYQTCGVVFGRCLCPPKLLLDIDPTHQDIFR